MHVKRPRLPNFEACSVALFASLALGGATLPARSQAASALSARFAPAARPHFAALGPARSNTALRHHDPKAELARHLDRVGDKDGSISSANFDEALK
jgi:hypothetical protein